MVQNHMLQLLCLVAMEPPTALDADGGARREAQGAAGAAPDHDGDGLAQDRARPVPRGCRRRRAPVRGYLEELGEATAAGPRPSSRIKAEVENWRWAGVPFYLRTGKRLPTRSPRS